MSKTRFKKKGAGREREEKKQQLADASEKDYSAVLSFLFFFFAQYGEIKANTVDVYFGLIFGYFSASRTKRGTKSR